MISTETLTEEDKSLIPYQGHKDINFQQREGFQFEVKTFSENIFFSDQEDCQDYYEYENYIINFVNDIPRTNINIQ